MNSVIKKFQVKYKYHFTCTKDADFCLFCFVLRARDISLVIIALPKQDKTKKQKVSEYKETMETLYTVVVSVK